MLDETKARGFSLTDRNYLDTVYEGIIWGIGVPVIGAGRVRAAMNLMFLRNAMSLETGIKTLVPLLRRAAAEIGTQLADDAGESVREKPKAPAAKVASALRLAKAR
jgi:DNA-binding IclR family transcriptional regulator